MNYHQVLMVGCTKYPKMTSYWQNAAQGVSILFCNNIRVQVHQLTQLRALSVANTQSINFVSITKTRASIAKQQAILHQYSSVAKRKEIKLYTKTRYENAIQRTVYEDAIQRRNTTNYTKARYKDAMQALIQEQRAAINRDPMRWHATCNQYSRRKHFTRRLELLYSFNT